MKNADIMTPDELRSLAKQKEEEEEFKAIATATLKHDLYYLDRDKIKSTLSEFSWHLTKNEYDSFINKIFEGPILLKGAIFEAIYDKDNDNNKYIWFDTDSGWIAEVGDDWAEEHLEDIKKA